MGVIDDWLARLGFDDPVGLARALSALPGRPVYPGPHPDRFLASFEWSVRASGEQIERARFAYSMDPERVAPGAIEAFLAPRASLSPALRACLARLHGSHFQVGLAGARAKLYLYPRGAPEGAIDALLDAAAADPTALARVRSIAGRAPGFVALDLEATVASKLYFEHDELASASAMLEALGEPALAARLATVSPAWGSPPARWVVSVRLDPRGPRDTTLHVKLDRDPAALAQFVSLPVRTALDELATAADAQGLVLSTSYASVLTAPGTDASETLYHRLERRAPGSPAA